MKNTMLFLLVCLLSLNLSAQDEVRKLDSFDVLSVSGGFNVDVFQGEPKAEITVERGELDAISMHVRNGELQIKYENKKWGFNNGSHKINIDLYVPNLEAINTSAGASVYGEFLFNSNDFSADASSGSSISIEVRATDLEVDVSSGATVEIEGSTKNLEVDVSSGASFNGKKLEAREVEADASSGASAKVWATKSIDANASSGASIKYKGNPSSTDLDSGKWSGGSIKKI